MPMCADTCINNERDARFQRALDSIVRLQERERHGIGMQKEKTLHAVLKAYEDPDEDHHEIPIGNYIADIYCRETESITEIQTANFGYLRGKLDAFLPQYHVTVVYPIPASKWGAGKAEPVAQEGKLLQRFPGPVQDLVLSRPPQSLHQADPPGYGGVQAAGRMGQGR